MNNGPRFPKTELEKDLTPVFFKEGKYDIVYRSFKLQDFINYFKDKVLHKEPKTEQQVIENNEQWVTTKMKKGQKGNWYEEYIVFDNNEVKAEEHMPDRFPKKQEIKDDLPY